MACSSNEGVQRTVTFQESSYLHRGFRYLADFLPQWYSSIGTQPSCDLPPHLHLAVTVNWYFSLKHIPYSRKTAHYSLLQKLPSSSFSPESKILAACENPFTTVQRNVSFLPSQTECLELVPLIFSAPDFPNKYFTDLQDMLYEIKLSH